jgi:hypothetical protein
MYRDADEVESFGAEAPVLAGRLRALLEHLGITTAPRYRVKEVPRSGRVEFKAIVEIFFGSRILCRHKGLAFRTSRSDAVANAAWQAITSWVRSNKIKEMEKDGKRKVPFSRQSSESNVRPRFMQPNQFFKPPQMNWTQMPI